MWRGTAVFWFSFLFFIFKNWCKVTDGASRTWETSDSKNKADLGNLKKVKRFRYWTSKEDWFYNCPIIVYTDYINQCRCFSKIVRMNS
jgi:hypothetical protein